MDVHNFAERLVTCSPDCRPAGPPIGGPLASCLKRSCNMHVGFEANYMISAVCHSTNCLPFRIAFEEHPVHVALPPVPTADHTLNWCLNSSMLCPIIGCAAELAQKAFRA